MIKNVGHPDILNLDIVIMILLKLVVAIPLPFKLEAALLIYIEHGVGHRSQYKHRQHKHV
jgi:hypothetical protein